MKTKAAQYSDVKLFTASFTIHKKNEIRVKRFWLLTPETHFLFSVATFLGWSIAALQHFNFII